MVIELYFFIFFILIILRLMGKREVGELAVIDVVVFVIMAEVAAMAIESPDKKLISFNCADYYSTFYSNIVIRIFH